MERGSSQDSEVGYGALPTTAFPENLDLRHFFLTRALVGITVGTSPGWLERSWRVTTPLRMFYFHLDRCLLPLTCIYNVKL